MITFDCTKASLNDLLRDKTRAVKQGMMPQLFIGRQRLVQGELVQGGGQG
jgi:hypothetical protein